MELVSDKGGPPRFPEDLVTQIEFKIADMDDGKCRKMKIRTGRQTILPVKNKARIEEACALLGWQLTEFSRDQGWIKKELPADTKPLREKGEYVLHLKRIPL